MNLIVDIVIDELPGIYYRAMFIHEDMYIAKRFEAKPTMEDVINFVNECGSKLPPAIKKDATAAEREACANISPNDLGILAADMPHKVWEKYRNAILARSNTKSDPGLRELSSAARS